MVANIVLYGHPSPIETAEIEKSLFHKDVSFSVVLDKSAIDDPLTLDKIVETFPKNMVSPFDLFLLLSECLSNACTYGNVTSLGISIRKRASLLLISLFHIPALSPKVDSFIYNAKKGWMPDLEKDPPNGLGFPILMRLTKNITVNSTRSQLQLWIEIKNREESASS